MWAEFARERVLKEAMEERESTQVHCLYVEPFKGRSKDCIFETHECVNETFHHHHHCRSIWSVRWLVTRGCAQRTILYFGCRDAGNGWSDADRQWFPQVRRRVRVRFHRRLRVK